jgi:hypothetical protein
MLACASGTAAATLWPVLGERSGLPASRPQLLFQVLVLAPEALVLTLQAVVLTMHAAVLAVHVFVARQFFTQSRDLSVLLLDDNVPSSTLPPFRKQPAVAQSRAPVAC